MTFYLVPEHLWAVLCSTCARLMCLPRVLTEAIIDCITSGVHHTNTLVIESCLVTEASGNWVGLENNCIISASSNRARSAIDLISTYTLLIQGNNSYNYTVPSQNKPIYKRPSPLLLAHDSIICSPRIKSLSMRSLNTTCLQLMLLKKASLSSS